MNATAGNADTIRGLNMLLMKIRHRNTNNRSLAYIYEPVWEVPWQPVGELNPSFLVENQMS